MVRIVVLAVVAAWAGVIIPPLLRSRVDNRPNSSVDDFRRQLSTLQRTVPGRSIAPMRAMGRPLTQAPLQRPAVGQRSHSTTLHRDHSGRDASRDIARDMGRDVERGMGRDHFIDGGDRTGGLERRQVTRTHGDHTGGHRQVHVQRANPREAVRRRRANVLFVLGLTTVATLFLAATTKSNTMLYAFALAFVSLVGYCYLLVQLRSRGTAAHYDTWFNAA